ncbi:MAG: ferrous iron transport protein A [Lactobacillales bacterium]|jgi:ferrous iron transport protein A|nr:ferrous iron transport protein A [Lactobacillales bacterium]
MRSLDKATIGSVYKVKSLNVTPDIEKHLNDLGLIPGAKVAVISQGGGNGIIMLKNARIALNNDLLENICVVPSVEDESKWVTLDQLVIGDKAVVVGVVGKGAVKRHLMDMGITKGVNIEVKNVAPLGDPISMILRGYELSLRKDEAEFILVAKEEA